MSIRLRHVAAVNPPTHEFDVLPDTAELPFLPLEAVWPGDRLDTTRRQPKSAVSSGYTRFREGDILLPKITPTFQADRTVIVKGLEGGVGAGTTELHVVRAGPDADVRYLRYLLSSKKFLDEGEASMLGVAGQKRVPDDCLRDLRVPVVDLRHQRAIADYLDRETARIDALIEKKGCLVERLGERRQSLITGAVTGELGVSEMAACRQDQIPLIGDPRAITGGDRVSIRLKHLARITVSNVDKKTASDEQSICLCNYTDVYYNERITADLPFMEATASADQIDRFGLRGGDVLLTKDSETPDDIAVPAYVDADLPGVVCGYHLALLRPSPDVDGRYLFWALTSRSSREQFSALANGITRFGIRYDSFG